MGRTDLGAATAALDDEALTIVAQTGADDAPIRVRLSTIDRLSTSAGQLTIALRDGTQLTLDCEAHVELHDDLLVRCRTLPELTRTLRGFGSRRASRGMRDSAPHEQQRFFAPLLDARRRAWGTREPASTIAAFDAATLDAAFDAVLDAFAAERHADHAPARRALTAELSDLSEPLRAALAALRDAATAAAGAPDDLALWRAWAMQLRATFETADRVWLALDGALDATPWQP